MCKGCGKPMTFEARSLHLKLNPRCSKAESVAILGKPVSHRSRRTIDFKCGIISKLDLLDGKGIPHAQAVLLEQHTNITAKNLSDWLNTRDELFRAQFRGWGHKRIIPNKSRVAFTHAEECLYMRFVWRRHAKGLKVTDNWLRINMLKILADDKPHNWFKFGASPGWLSGFKKRYRITWQMRTNKKHSSVLDRLPQIKEFHRFLLNLQTTGIERSLKWGRFTPDTIFHMVRRLRWWW